MVWFANVVESDRYEEGTTVLRKEVKASEFVWSEKPLDMLGTITSMSFEDPDCKVIIEHELTTDEVCLMWSIVL